jgi:hypothetical protein
MLMTVADGQSNSLPLFIMWTISDNNKTKVSVGALVVEASGDFRAIMNLLYARPPDGYHGFNRAFERYCEVIF